LTTVIAQAGRCACWPLPNTSSILDALLRAVEGEV
jgi:hypothetical protein